MFSWLTIGLRACFAPATGPATGGVWSSDGAVEPLVFTPATTTWLWLVALILIVWSARQTLADKSRKSAVLAGFLGILGLLIAIMLSYRAVGNLAGIAANGLIFADILVAMGSLSRFLVVVTAVLAVDIVLRFWGRAPRWLIWLTTGLQIVAFAGWLMLIGVQVWCL